MLGHFPDVSAATQPFYPCDGVDKRSRHQSGLCVDVTGVFVRIVFLTTRASARPSSINASKPTTQSLSNAERD